MRQSRHDLGYSASSSPLLLSAAVAGLLCAATSGCTTKVEKQDPPGPGMITSSQIVDPFSLDDFTAKCDAAGGTVEVMAHCGGLASAKGFSYDITTKEWSEHSCKGANTCAGWNCAILE
jgi:hypothetical protein